MLDRTLIGMKKQLCKQVRIEYFGESVYENLSDDSSSLKSYKSKGKIDRSGYDIYDA